MVKNKIIEKIVSSKDAPENKYVFWLDTSVNPSVLKSYVAGNGWTSVTRDDSEDAKIETLESNVSSLQTDKLDKNDYNRRGFYLNLDIADTSTTPEGSIIIKETIVDRTDNKSDAYECNVTPSEAPSLWEDVFLLGSVFIYASDFKSYVQTVDWVENQGTEVISVDGGNSQITVEDKGSGNYDVSVLFENVDDNNKQYTGTTTIDTTNASLENIVLILEDENSNSAENIPTVKITISDPTAQQFIGPEGVFAFKIDLVRYNVSNSAIYFHSYDEAYEGGPVFIDTAENILEYKNKLSELDSRITTLEEA